MPRFESLVADAEPGEHYAKGDHVFDVGDAPRFMYVVKSGEVEIHRGGRLVETAERGTLIGEFGLVTGELRSARAVAASDCELVPIDRRRFEFLVANTPGFALRVMQTLVARLRRNEG